MSDDIKRDYNEAGSIVFQSPRGAAALLRLAIQKLCKELGEPGKDLNRDIQSLVDKGLNEPVQQALDAVRVIGNEAVHPGTMDLRDDRATAMTLFGLVNLIVEEMVTRKNRAISVYSTLPPEKLKGIKERQEKANKEADNQKAK